MSKPKNHAAEDSALCITRDGGLALDLVIFMQREKVQEYIKQAGEIFAPQLTPLQSPRKPRILHSRPHSNQTPMPAKPTPPDFLIHDDRDHVGVVVVEGVAAGQGLRGWSMQSDAGVDIAALDAIPLGHKIALRDIAAGEDVIKYGEVIGAATADIRAGGHLHIHNTKTKKW